ncbi:MAG: inositol monophosphatase family protein [Candidatus Methylomirabilia bacterium]
MPTVDLIGSPAVPETLLARMLQTAVSAAAAAGEAQLRLFRKGPLVRAVYDHDLTLEVDKQCENAMIKVIKGAFPHHGIISEEGGTEPGDEPYLWVLDPLDGTVNYYHGIPFFCACVSCHQRPDSAVQPAFSRLLGTIAAAVCAPALGETYAAAHGCGAELNGRALACSETVELGSAIVGVSLGSRRQDTEDMLRLCRSLGAKARKLRSFGATGYDLAQVAAGRLGGLAQKSVNLWDAAAGALILEEAGGAVEGRPVAGGRWDIVAAAPGIHAPLRTLAHEAWTASA